MSIRNRNTNTLNRQSRLIMYTKCDSLERTPRCRIFLCYKNWVINPVVVEAIPFESSAVSV